MKRITLLLLAICISLISYARTETLLAFKNVIPKGYDFFVKLPSDTTATDSLPVVLFLHGRSLCGSDLNKVLKYGSVDAIRKGVQINAIVVAPQTSVVGWNSRKLNDVLEFVIEKYHADRNRIYVIGMSMGGWGTLKMVQDYPEKIAAGMALCGGYAQSAIDGLLQVPLWIIHGTNDNITPCSCSRIVVDKMNSTGKAERLLSDFPACNHSLLARVFYLEDLYGWLLSHSLADENRAVNKDFEISLNKITNAYKYIKHGPITFNIQPGK